jgi:F-type H+-transporting ATPase subunit b
MKQEHGEHPGSAEGAHGGHASTGTPHINLWSWDQHAPPVGWYAVNFLIFIIFLVKAAKKPLAAAMQRRHDSIKATIEENQKAYDAAKERHDTYRQKLAHGDAESRELIEHSKEDGALERDRIIAGAHEYAKRLREDAQTVIEQEEERARERLQIEVARAALKGAEDMLRRGLTDADRDRLFEQSLQMIESSGAHRRTPNDRKSAPVADGAA